ncbi:AbfB domain-containing protein [Streptomyces sp. NPDC056891]|uniref:AbfB domain-containing protein n=1 Tax=unclassified Streptomyces TaxID=2593676 RepID=UPI0036927EA6
MVEMVNIQSFNRQDMYVQSHNFEGELNPFDPNRKSRFVFQVERGQAFDGTETVPTVRFKSVRLDEGDFYLRHRNFRLYLEAWNPATPVDVFADDSLYFVRGGKSGNVDAGWISFQSFNFRDRWIRHRDYHVYVESLGVNPASAREDATFKMVPTSWFFLEP